MNFTLRARWVLPIDSPPIEGGYVGVVAGRIAAVGGADPGVGPVNDLGAAVLAPGVVNAHTHLEFSGLAGPLGAPGISLPAWIRLVIADRHRKQRDARAGIAAGLAESLAAGVTTLGEIATAPAGDYQLPSGAPQPTTVLFQEAIGFSAGRVDSAFADVEQRLAATGGAPAGLSPHAPYTVHPRLLEKIVALAAARGVPVAMHLAESREELELMADGAGDFRALLEERSMWDSAAILRDVRPLDYLRVLAGAPRSLVIHGNYLAEEEIAFLADRRDRMSVVYCPRTHTYFGHARYPLERMLAAGVRVALGTDSRASNPDLSLLSELRAAAEFFPALDPAMLLRMATLDGAVALGLGEHAGSLTPGKRADLVALSCPAADGDPYAALLGDAAPTGVWLTGRPVG